MSNDRSTRAKRNIVVSLAEQIVSLLCGFVVPRLMIGAYGSEAYGATSSIVQFLAYITLLEGGIGGVARAALYKPLAENSQTAVSAVMMELQHFFRIVAFVFLGYVLVLACSFSRISGVQVFDWGTTALLVIVISVSTFAQYFIGITNSVLLQAAQKTYITTAVSITATIANTIMTVLLIGAGYSLLVVKVVSSILFVLRPLALHIYVKRTFSLPKTKQRNTKLLKQKWTGLGQHIAFFLHSNTDVMVLTLCANLSSVAVYSVYNMIVSHIQSLTVSFASGMEALFGEMIAKEEYEVLNRTFDIYETLISVVSVIMLSVTAVMILPFIGIYTDGIADVNYMEPVFALVLVMAALVYCLRTPYHAAVIAAGRFKQTRAAAYGEAALNVGLSLLLVNRFGLVGVAIGTLAATAFRFLYYVWYLSHEIACRKISLFVRRSFANAVGFAGTLIFGRKLIGLFTIENYWSWVCAGILCVIFSAAITMGINMLFYHNALMEVLRRYVRRK